MTKWTIPLFLGAACLLLPRIPVDAKPPCPIGISMNLPAKGTIKTLIADLQATKALGANLQFISCSWKDLEPSPSEYVWKPVVEPCRGLGSLGFTEILTIKTLDTNNRNLPSDLQSKPFDSPEVLERFGHMLRAMIPQLPPNVKAISLGNEVDVYLGLHPDETEPFMALMDRGRQVVKELRPDLPVAITATFDGLRDRPAIVTRLNKQTGVVFMTYYPMGHDFHVHTPKSVGGDFDRIARFAGMKRVFLQEIGYPASPMLRSSDGLQAQFVDAVFAQLGKHPATFAGANFFLLYDFTAEQLDTFVKYYGVGAPQFRAFLATLGFRHTDSAPRPAWKHFQTNIRSLR